MARRALSLSIAFSWLALNVWRDESGKAAGRLFGFSLIYLFVLFAALLVDNALGIRGA